MSFAEITHRVSNARHFAVEWELLRGVPTPDVRRLLAVARRRTFSRGEVVFHEGDPADSLHLIAKGRFAVRVRTPPGDEAVLTLCGPGEAFGELALVSGAEAVRAATVEALEAGETHAVYRREFDRLRQEHPGVTDVLVAVLAEQVRRRTPSSALITHPRRSVLGASRHRVPVPGR